MFYFRYIGSITWLRHGNRPPGMLSIWMACEARRSKTTHGDGGSLLRKALGGKSSKSDGAFFL